MNKIIANLTAKKRGATTKEKVTIQLELPDYMRRFILNDIKGDLRIALSNRGYAEEYEYSSSFPKITITIE